MTARTLPFIIIFFLFSLFATAQGPYTLPSNFYDADCVFVTERFDMTIAEKYRSGEVDVSTYYSAVVGDLDGDGFGEIVIPGGVHNRSQFVFIYDHQARLKKKIDLPIGVTMHTDFDSVILADLDNDGRGEIIVTASNGQLLLIYNMEGDLLASETIPTKFSKTVGVANFKSDKSEGVLPEIYVGNRIYAYDNGALILLVAGNNTLQATMAQDINGDGIPELVSASEIYEVRITNRTRTAGNAITKLAECNDVSPDPYDPSKTYTTRTFALADVDLDGQIDVVSLVPIFDPNNNRIEVTVWDSQTGVTKYRENLSVCTGGSFIRNSWPFIGDTDNNGYPDIIFMGGINQQFCTTVYRLEYDRATNRLVVRATNNQYNDYSSMSTSMSMFDFNNDGKQEIVYRDETSLYIINGEDLSIEKELDNCTSGTGWEYPVVASLSPSGESSIIITSGEVNRALTGTLRIYGADTANGAKPWIPARKVWNQFSFYQNTIFDNLQIIANPAPLNWTLTSTDGRGKTMQPFNGHMLQLGIIRRSTLESVYPLANISSTIDYGYNRVSGDFTLDVILENIGDAPMDPPIPINIYKVLAGDTLLVYSHLMTDVLDNKGDNRKEVSLVVNSFEQYLPFDQMVIKVAKGKFDCDTLSNQHIIYPADLSNLRYVKKGELGSGKSWNDALGEVEAALVKAKQRNTKYPNSVTEIWVAAGSYYGNFEMQEGVNIYGGFYGDEIEKEDSRPLKNLTILDAQGNGRPLTQLTAYTILTEWRGLVLQNGKINDNGGGAFLQQGSTLSYSIVKNNISTKEQGGGIYATNSKIVNCIIEQNSIEGSTKAVGSGVYAINGSQIVNNTIVKNTVVGTDNIAGVGVYASASSVFNNIIYKNGKISDTELEVNNLFSQGGAVDFNLSTEDDSIDPKFLKFEEDNYSLIPTSAALNAGSNTYISGYTLDIEGADRIYENKTVDQGAFEYQGLQLALSKEGYFYVNSLKGGDGSSWNNAVGDLSEALKGAKLVNQNTPKSAIKIWVAGGTYSGAFEMVEGVDLHGGFAGNETDFNQIDTVANKTYIDAQNAGRALTQTKDFSTPTEWAGVIIQNGYLSGQDEDVYGGGAYLRKNGILRYSTVRNNKAVATSNFNEVNAYGGGVYMQEGASLLNSTIENNVAEVINLSPATITNGVAQGGGVNNVKNRLTYLSVKKNKTVSGGNTDGGAIYSSGDIVNSVVNENTGKSTVALLSDRVIVNSTIVDNTGEYVITGSTSNKVQNSIVYNNTTSVANFLNVAVDNTNLIDIDPLFQSGSFKLQTGSRARIVGRVEFFPADLDVDMANERRYITLKNNVRIIDAGAYQSNIKIVSATDITIEVPFGTKFEDLNLSDLIIGTLEKEYQADCNVSWLQGVYNELLDGAYVLYGDLSSLPGGVINPDAVQGIINVVVKKNHIADIEGLSINGEDWMSTLEKAYIIDCESALENVSINIELPYFATIQFEPNIEYTQLDNEINIETNVVKPGNHSIVATITSQDGLHTAVYPITIVKYFPFWDIIEQRWNNTFSINNNKETNGGYKFVSYKWYKDNKEIGTEQYYSAGDKRTDLLDDHSLYRAEMVGTDGVTYYTCAESPVLMNYGIKVYPNPVTVGGNITIEAPLADNQKGSAFIYSLSGIPTKQEKLTSGQTIITAPNTPGLYILRIVLDGGVSESLRIMVY